MIFVFLGVLCFCLVGPSSWAESESAFNVSMGGRGYHSGESSGIFAGKLRVRYEGSERWRWRADGEWIYESSHDELAFGGQELRMELGSEKKFLSAGLVSAKFGGAGVLNPWSQINAKDRHQPQQTLTLPSPGVQYEHRGLSSLFSITLWPWRWPDRLPGAHSVWWPRQESLPLKIEDPVVLLSKNPEYNVQPAKDLDTGLRNNLAVQWKNEIFGTDIALFYFEGHLGAPSLVPTLNGKIIEVSPRTVLQLDDEVEIQPIYSRRRATGYHLQKEIWNLILQHHLLIAENVSDPSLRSTQLHASVEKFINSRLFSGLVFLEYAKVWEAESSELQNMVDIFSDTTLLGARWNWTNDSSLTIGYLHHLLSHANLAQVQVDTRWTSTWSTALSLFSLFGPAESLSGIYSPNSYAQLQVIASF